jgi:hypothetical protein
MCQRGRSGRSDGYATTSRPGQKPSRLLSEDLDAAAPHTVEHEWGEDIRMFIHIFL